VYVNGKEASAYLQHISSNYDRLARQTFFLHSDPASHINFESFIRTLIWSLVCDIPIGFMHLNAIYMSTSLSSSWGTCCGVDSACKTSLFQYLNASIPGTVTAYKGGQFVASDTIIRNQTKLFWQSLLALFDTSHPLSGCTVFDDWGRGPLIGAQLERVWHVLMKRSWLLPSRVTDEQLPMYLRTPECSGFKNCHGAV